MMVYIDFSFLKEIRSADLLTYSALVLAFLAYCRALSRDLESWRSLFVSFKNDLENQKGWLAGEYFAETYKEKKSFSPGKIIYPLSFESLPEIIRRGVAEFSWINSNFSKHLSIFNERIIAFNSALDHVKKIISADPIKSEKLLVKLNKLGLDEESIGFDDFKNKINKLKVDEKNDILYLADNIHRVHKMIHVKIIGNRNNEDKLNYLYHETVKELGDILKNFDKRIPFFIRYQECIILTSLLVFFIVEIFLKNI